jgi:hypothetical protein
LTLEDQFLHLAFPAGQGGAHLRDGDIVHRILTDIRIDIFGS